jgi:hypothetical protein
MQAWKYAARQIPDDQQEYKKQAPIDEDINAKQTRYPKPASHGLLLSLTVKRYNIFVSSFHLNSKSSTLHGGISGNFVGDIPYRRGEQGGNIMNGSILYLERRRRNMIRNLRDLIGFRVAATDIDVGTVRDFYFDDQAWKLRYFVADLDEAFGNRSVLLAPLTLSQPDMELHIIPAQVSSDKLMNSPDIDMNKPVSRQEEEQIYQYYDWPVYWNPVGGFGLGVGDLSSIPMMEMEADLREQSEETEVAQERGEDPRLRSIDEVTGYHIMARDNSIGEVQDFLIEDNTWRIVYLLVDINGILPGGKVILSPEWVERVSWSQSLIYVDLSADTIKSAPAYNPDQIPDRDYESRLYDYYHRPKYWDKDDPAKY